MPHKDAFGLALTSGDAAAVARYDAARSLLQRRLGRPDAAVLLQGIAFVLILASEALRDTDWKALWTRLTNCAALPQAPSPAQPAVEGKTT